MAIDVKDVQEKTILETQLKQFLDVHLSIEQIQNLLQLKTRQTALHYIKPKEMKMTELLYRPTDKNGVEIPGADIAQLKTRYYVPKNIWAEFLIEEKWANRYKCVLMERFTFTVGKKVAGFSFTVGKSVRHISVVRKIPTQLDENELLSTLLDFKRPKNFTIVQQEMDGAEGKVISASTHYQLTRLCDYLEIKAPGSQRSLLYYDPIQFLWLYNTGLYKSDIIMAYDDKIQHETDEERFNAYYNKALETLSSSKKPFFYDNNDTLLPYQLLSIEKPVVDEIISPTWSIDEVKSRSKSMVREPFLNQLLLLYNSEEDKQRKKLISNVMAALSNKIAQIKYLN